MIQVREVFNVKFGRAKEAVALAREGVAIEEANGGAPTRLLTDLTGPYYQLVMEAEYESLAAFEAALEQSLQAPEFRAWYPKFAALIDGGRREIYRLVAA
ncbi:MAG TPA: NIPSNAP family protein [Longimicrobium sp.]|nr:NIPSNAP family protein [Longimicrobium sp.]